MPAAASLAAKIKESTGIEASLVRGAGGIFDVSVDGDLFYSKFETQQFPDETELTARLTAEQRRRDDG